MQIIGVDSAIKMERKFRNEMRILKIAQQHDVQSLRY